MSRNSFRNPACAVYIRDNNFAPSVLNYALLPENRIRSAPVDQAVLPDYDTHITLFYL